MMMCPRCEASLMKEMKRDGVTVDVCGECRGMWLDRGELEKLIARAGEFERPHPRRAPDDDYDHDYERPPRRSRYDDERRGQRPRKRGGLFDTLGELFD